jgi:hypothetical protein
MKHTQGEWITTKIKHFRILSEIGDELAVVNSEVEEGEANAKLMAAAPELLELCTEAFKVMRKHSIIVNKEAGLLIEMDKAIKKATE